MTEMSELEKVLSGLVEDRTSVKLVAEAPRAVR